MARAASTLSDGIPHHAKVVYHPGVFDVADEAQARRIILTSEGPGADTDTRWSVETPYLADLIDELCRLHAGSVVLDYGCGIGRLAKAVIERHGCTVIGVDASTRMLGLARTHVRSDNLIAVCPHQLDAMVRAGLRVDAFLCVWVLQHCFRPADDIARIRRSLTDDGRGFVLNMRRRAIPALVEEASLKRSFRWAQDAVDVRALLDTGFRVEREGVPDPAKVPNSDSYWLALRAHPAPDTEA